MGVELELELGGRWTAAGAVDGPQVLDGCDGTGHGSWSGEPATTLIHPSCPSCHPAILPSQGRPVNASAGPAYMALSCTQVG